MAEITINLHDQPCGNCTICIGRTIGAKHEQERIIKLLEDERIDWHCDQCLGESLFDIGYENGWVKEKIIALIKGEK